MQNQNALEQCPKCGHGPQDTQAQNSTECAKCGIIFMKYFVAQENKRLQREKEEAKIAAARPKEIPKVESKTTSCPSCNGLVAYDIKACPHCGKANPATRPKEESKIVKIGGLAFAGAVLVLMFQNGSHNANSPPSSTSASEAEKENVKETAATLINFNGRLCARVTDMARVQGKPDLFDITCTEYRSGTGTVQYILDSKTGKVLPK